MTMSVIFLTMRWHLDKKRTYLHSALLLLLVLVLLLLLFLLLLSFGVAFMRLFARRFVCRSTFARCVTDVNMDGPAQSVSVSPVYAVLLFLLLLLLLLLHLFYQRCRCRCCCCCRLVVLIIAAVMTNAHTAWRAAADQNAYMVYYVQLFIVHV